MGKKNKKIKDIYIKDKTFREIPKGHAWTRAEDFFDGEIKPIVDVLQSEQITKNHEAWLKNYLVIRLVSVMEDFFKTLVRERVDEYKIPLSLLYSGEAKMSIRHLDELLSNKKNGTRTIGEIIANESSFANFMEINTLFTKLLKSDKKFGRCGKDFLSGIKQLDWYNPYKKKFSRAKSLNKNWDNFQKVFDVRNDIVHRMKNAELSIHQIASLSDNALNAMDAASAITQLSEIDVIVKIMKSNNTLKEEILEDKKRIKKDK